MAAPIAARRLAGDTPSAAALSYNPPAVPPDPGVLQRQVLQLQNTLNALIHAFNAHSHTDPGGPEAIWDGAVVTAHATGLAVDVSVGDVVNTDGSFTAIPAVSNLALSTADGTHDRIDVIQVVTATGVVSKKSGTAAASPVAPAVDAGNIGLATVLVPATATAPSTITDTRARPDVDLSGVPTPLIDGSAATATNLFTAS